MTGGLAVSRDKEHSIEEGDLFFVVSVNDLLIDIFDF